MGRSARDGLVWDVREALVEVSMSHWTQQYAVVDPRDLGTGATKALVQQYNQIQRRGLELHYPAGPRVGSDDGLGGGVDAYIDAHREQWIQIAARRTEMMPTTTTEQTDEQTDLHVGDTVQWRGAWGTEAARRVVVTALYDAPVGCKDGPRCVPVASMCWTRVGQHAIVDLANGHWAYGRQIAR